jgi:hypothetical protein
MEAGEPLERPIAIGVDDGRPDPLLETATLPPHLVALPLVECRQILNT